MDRMKTIAPQNLIADARQVDLDSFVFLRMLSPQLIMVSIPLFVCLFYFCELYIYHVFGACYNLINIRYLPVLRVGEVHLHVKIATCILVYTRSGQVPEADNRSTQDKLI